MTARYLTLSTAKAGAAALRREIRKHHGLCATCYRYRPNASRYCRDGYDLACRLAAAEEDIRRLTPPDTGPPAGLF